MVGIPVGASCGNIRFIPIQKAASIAPGQKRREALLILVVKLFVVIFYYLKGIFFESSCHIETRCENIIRGTINDGNKTNGKYPIAILGWSKANC